jgi:two-component system, OmpR family, sensor histidine kinase KdpD
MATCRRGEAGSACGRLSQPLRRSLAGYALAAVLVSLLTLGLTVLRGPLNLTTDASAFLIAAIAVALAGHAARCARQAAAEAEAARPIAEADRARATLLAVVSHDLRTPLAAAKAAVSCLRSRELRLTVEDHHELLATADESLDLLNQLAASLLDMRRLQAGAVPVFPGPADLGEIVTRSLASLGPGPGGHGRHSGGLPQVTADPVIMERVIANVTANALRYSPGGSPPLLTASACGDRIEVRVIDHGPGVPEADQDRMFAPFQRLGGTSSPGVGLGLTVSRGLTEAISLPAVHEPAQAPCLSSRPGSAGRNGQPDAHAAVRPGPPGRRAPWRYRGSWRGFPPSR